MSAKSEISARRRRVALLLAEGMSTNEIAGALKVRWDVADADVKAVEADPNNIDYLQPKHALGRLLDNYDRLEREARDHLARSIADGKMEAANRWFESIRRLAEDRGRVLQQIGVLNRAAEDAPRDEPEGLEDLLSPRARKLMARIALAEKMGHRWRGEIDVEDTTALDPVPDTEPPIESTSALERPLPGVGVSEP
jgi:hypothetical protein